MTHFISSVKKQLSDKSIYRALGTAVLLAVPTAAFAQFSLPIIDGIGCDIVNWMKGPLAIIVFLLVVVATIVIGLFARMDWTKILSVIVLYGVLQGLATILLSSGQINLPACFR